jgi:hypothetical protein
VVRARAGDSLLIQTIAGRVPLRWDGASDHALAQDGHLWGRKEVAIALSAVTGADGSIWLNITKRQVRDSPLAGIDHPDA